MARGVYTGRVTTRSRASLLAWAATTIAAAGCAGPRLSADPPPLVVTDVTWAALSARAQELLQRLVAVDTARPRGARRAAPDLLQAFLRRESVPAEVVAVGGGRYAVWGRVEAVDAQGPPVVLVSHLDTPSIDPAAWPAEIPPFALTVRDGQMWGAGLNGGKGVAVLHATSLAVLASVGGPRSRDVHMVALPDALDLTARSLDRVIAAVPALATATVALSGGGYDVPDWFGDGRTVQAVSVGERATAVVQVAAVTRSDGIGPRSGERLARALVAIKGQSPLPRLTATNRALLRASATGLSAPRRWLRRSGLASQLFVVPELAARPGLSTQFVDRIRIVRLASGYRGGTQPPQRSRAFIRIGMLDDATPGTILRRLRRIVGDPDVHITVRLASPLSKSKRTPDWLNRLRRAAQPTDDAVTVPILGWRPQGTDPLRRVDVPVLGYVPLPFPPEAVDGDGPWPIDRGDFRRGLERMATLVANLSAR